jgi:hypothetical protein
MRARRATVANALLPTSNHPTTSPVNPRPPAGRFSRVSNSYDCKPCPVRRTEKGVPVLGLRQGAVLEGEPEEARGRQARVQARGVPVRHMRARVLLAELADDAHLHVPQDAAHDAATATTASRAPAAVHALRRQILVFDIQR